tara:strand:- start:9998 stop:12016 length:2019 start_codon:yes stop_codon:yes gene_type:complete
MAESSPILTNFTSGELSPRLNGRIDMEKYYNGASTINNFQVLMHGGLQKRSGTRYIAPIKTQTGSNSGARLIPFVFSKTQAYILEFGHNYIRFFKDEGQITSGGSVYEISTTYTAAQIDQIEYVQSADVLYLVHDDHAPRKLSRTGHTSWTLTDVDFFDGPYEPANTSSTTLQPSGTSGNITITASSNVFVANDVGRSVRIKNGSDWGFAKITGYNSATNVNATVNADMPFSATSANADWRLGSFYTNNYPTKITFFEERLFYAGTTQQPSTVFSSMSADFDKFSPTSKDGSVNDDNGLQFTLVSDQVNQITGMYGGKFLAIFTKNGAFNMSSGSATQGLTPTTIQVVNETNDGAADKKVSPASKSVLFIGKNKKRLREFAYNIDYDSFTTPDMTVLSEHVGFGGFEECAFANYPNNILWVRRGDGVLLGFTYYRDQDVTAWHRHTIAGTNAKVKSIAVIPGVDDAFDTLYLIVERTINSATTQYVEFLEQDFRGADGDTKDDQFYVDSGLTYSGSAATSISGLSHLEGQTVAVLNNGAVESNKTVSSGSITLTNSTTKCHVGLPFTAELESVNVEPKSQYGTTQGKRGRIDKVIFRLFETVGLKAGPASSSVDVVPFRTTTSTMSATDPKTGDYTFLMPATYTTENKLYVKSDTAQACTISAIMIQMSTYS